MHLYRAWPAYELLDSCRKAKAVYRSDKQELAALSLLGKSQSLSSMMAFLSVAVGWFSLPLEVLFRFNLGARYLSSVRITLAYAPILLAMQIATEFGGSFGPWLTGFLLISFGATLVHRVRIWRWERRGEHVYTYSFGESPLTQVTGRIDDWKSYKYVEPMLGFAAWFGTQVIDQRLGVYLFFSSTALLLHHQLIYAQWRDVAYDMADSSTFDNFYSAAAAGRPKREVHGLPRPVVVVPASPRTGIGSANYTPVRQSGASTTLEDVLGPSPVSAAAD